MGKQGKGSFSIKKKFRIKNNSQVAKNKVRVMGLADSKLISPGNPFRPKDSSRES